MIVSNDFEFLNSVANHPDVYKWICGPLTGPIDTRSLLLDGRNYFLQCDDGGFLFIDKGDEYEVHTQFLPSKKTDVAKVAKEAVDYMFSIGAERISTMVPTLNEPALKLALSVGFKHDGQVGMWPIEGKDYPLHRYILESPCR